MPAQRPLPIVLFKWGGLFSPDHVHRVRNMLARHLHMHHEVVCITDDARGIDSDIRVIPLWSDLRHETKCSVRIKAFCPSMADLIGPRFAWMDLDMVITDDVTPIFSRTEDFIISGVARRPNPYNGSLVMMNAACRRQVYDEWDIARLEREKKRLGYGSCDQAWIAIVLGPDEATWTHEDGIYTYRDFVMPARTRKPYNPRRMGHFVRPTYGAMPKGCRIMVMNGPRYDPANRRYYKASPWLRYHWQ